MTIHDHQQSLLGQLIHQRYEIHRSLGIGAYAQVYLARDLLQPSSWYAIKTLPPCTSAKQRGLQRMEIGLHARVTPHPHILQLHQVLRSPISHHDNKQQMMETHMVLEYSPEGDLFTAITERHLYVNQPSMIRHVFLQLIRAVRHCHQSGVYHRDLKSENIMVFDGGWTVKLGDFGLATTDPVSKDYGCGSTFYFSPECQGDFDEHRQGYATAPNDIWSLGIILINLTTGRNPWHRASFHDPAFRMYMDDPSILMTMLPTISVPLHRILKRVLSIHPQDRMTLDELEHAILHCPFFTGSLLPIVTNNVKSFSQVGLPSPPTTPGRHPCSFINNQSVLDNDDDDDLLFSPLETPISPLLHPPRSIHLDEQNNKDCSLFLDQFSSLKI
ncbi:kinase-like domain-containing protein [Halteromyces radiatus]|uniref:kinase-like domain-containing protein n=1 Tax=Halteromyces radiatus TaxID=101107 RepID=UPI0022210415|nr:kinase-like domain-containing protein [Halteromyces radiatus]KAI8078879.1 kinase-like domain-containing protein [Halteromyces radiatus]